MHLLPPPPGYCYASFFVLAGPGHLHEIAVSAFTRSPLGRANKYSMLSLRLIPRMPIRVSPISRCFSALAFPFFHLYLTPPKLPRGHHLFLVSSYNLPYFLNYAIPPYSSSPSCYFLPYSSINDGLETSFWACSLLYAAISTFSCLYLS